MLISYPIYKLFCSLILLDFGFALVQTKWELGKKPKLTRNCN